MSKMQLVSTLFLRVETIYYVKFFQLSSLCNKSKSPGDKDNKVQINAECSAGIQTQTSLDVPNVYGKRKKIRVDPFKTIKVKLLIQIQYNW